MDLTTNGIRTIVGMTSSSSDPSFQPIFQLISIKAVGNSNGIQRFRAVLSDGTHFVQGMLATQLNHMVESNELRNDAVISVEDFMNNSVQGRNVIILLKISVIGNPGERIGNPSDIEKSGTAQSLTGASAVGVKAAPMYNRTNTPMNSSLPVAKAEAAKMPSPQKNPYSPPSRHSNAPIVHRGTSASPSSTPITLISQLNMYQNRWVIKARVVSKSDIRTWSNARGEGSLFSVELLDSSGVDIKATFFKEAVDKFYNLMQPGQVYELSGGRIKVASMQYNTCKSQYELSFDQNANIRLTDDSGDIQAQSFDLMKIADLERAEVGKTVDVLAIVQEIGDVQSLTSKKTGRELQKCDLTLLDDTGVQVRLTLWGNEAVNAKNTISPTHVVAFKKARIGDFGGVSLSGASGIFVEPQIPETDFLKQWWQAKGSTTSAIKSLSNNSSGGGGKMDSFSERKAISDIKNLNLGFNNEKGDYLCFKAHFSFIKKDKEGGAWYTACPNMEEPCRNRCKVTQTTDGNWQCDRCQGTYPNCSRKWIFSATVADSTASTWVSIFDDQATGLFGGVTADQVFAEFDNQDFYDSHFAKAMYTEWIFKCRVKNEFVNEEQRQKTQVVRMDPVDYVSECRDMLNEIRTFV